MKKTMKEWKCTKKNKYFSDKWNYSFNPYPAVHNNPYINKKCRSRSYGFSGSTLFAIQIAVHDNPYISKQCRSRSDGFSGSTLFAIQIANLNE